ncbi:complement C1s subcomponent [Esox lucius]|uniref:Complement component 1, s subcomponent n=1 Tax=Esox lucius TaxID=8010 RepID=A0A3P9ABN9_ESOLU|nr:complement C1s subcomponent [Esox lucius]
MPAVSLCLFLLPLHATASILSGWVESPGYPRGYPPDSSLNWSRCAPPGHVVALTLTHLDVEDSDGCEHDALEIFADGNQIDVLCGEKSFKDLDSMVNPMLLSSAKGCLSLSFHSDYSNTKRHTGFRGFYTLQDFDECEEDPDNGCTQFCHNYIGGYQCSCRPGYYLDTDEHTCTVSCTEDLSGSLRGVVSSPSWPHPYAEHARCSYTLSVEDHLQLLLHFTGDFDVEQRADGRCVDALTVETSAGTLGPFCGSVAPPSPLHTKAHHARVVFSADGQGSNKGFTLRYSVTPKTCPGIVTSKSTMTPQQTEYHHGDTVTVTCDPGSVLDTGDDAYKSSCQRTGEWSPVQHCEPVNCGQPDISDEVLKLVDKNPNTLFLDEIQFECESKYYKLEWDEKYICEASGKWTSVNGQQSFPKCIEVCGIPEEAPSSSGRIMGGRAAKLEEIPWQLLTKYPRRGGASLINDRWALTAAHVVDGYEESPITFFGGLIDALKGKEDEKDTVVMKTKKIIIHPNYVKGILGNERTNYDNDIALIRMSSRVKLGPTVLPVCLPDVDGGLKEQQVGGVSGWGAKETKDKTKINEKSQFLRYTEVTRLEQKKCEDTPSLPNNKRMVFTENMLCAGSDGKDSCRGDSGGPLFYPRLSSGNQKNRAHRLVGIVSWGSPCEVGNDSTKGYYTKVEKYLDWIMETMKREDQGEEQGGK